MTPQQLKAMKLALEALNDMACWEEGREVDIGFDEPYAADTSRKAITAINEVLAEHAMRETQRLRQEVEQEPVAWVSEDVCKGQYIDGRPRKIWWECEKGVGTAFYTTPPQRKPLLASEIVTMYAECPTSDNDMIAFARAIEAAHGIKETK